MPLPKPVDPGAQFVDVLLHRVGVDGRTIQALLAAIQTETQRGCKHTEAFSGEPLRQAPYGGKIVGLQPAVKDQDRRPVDGPGPVLGLGGPIL